MYLFILNKFMDMKAFRADLQQKSFNARKTNNYEDRINVTYKGMVSENSEEYYKELSENLEKSVNFLSGLLRAAEYQSINVGIQNALRGRSNNLNEIASPAVTPAPAVPAPAPAGPPAWIEPLLPPRVRGPITSPGPGVGGLGVFPKNPSPGDSYKAPNGTIFIFVNGDWIVWNNPNKP
jgi:hypothetical protein